MSTTTPTNQPAILNDEALAELERDISTCDSAVFPITIEMAAALCQTVRALRAESTEWERQARINQKAYGDEMIKNTALREQLAEARAAAFKEAVAWAKKVQSVKLNAANAAALDDEFAALRLQHEADGALRVIETLEAAASSVKDSQPVAHRRDCGMPDCFICYGGKG